MTMRRCSAWKTRPSPTCHARESGHPTFEGVWDFKNEVGFPEFSNEVQHQIRVLRWEQNMISSRWKNAVKLPAYTPMDVRSGKSLQLWIARHRASLAS